MEPISASAAAAAAYKLIIDFVTGREKRRVRLFNGLIAPAYVAFQEVHKEYQRIFRALQEEPQTHTENDELNSLSDRRKLIEQANRLRSDSNDLRWALRANCQQLLTLFKHEEEKRFLVALALYFIDHEVGDRPSRPEELDYGWSLLVRDKGSDGLPSPSMNLISHLNNKIYDDAAFRQEVSGTLTRLDERSSLVSSSFTHLKFVILSITSASGASAKEG